MVPKELTEQKSKEESQSVKTFWRGMAKFWAVSSQVVTHGSVITNLKWSSKVHNGNLPIRHGQKNSSVQMKNRNNVPDFFDIRGIVYYEFVPTGQTVNQFYYLEVLEKLSENVRRKRPETFANN